MNHTSPQQETFLKIPEATGNRLVQPGSILRIEALGNYSKIYFTNKEKALVVSKVLRWLEYQLPEDMFIRVHRSHLVNKMYVRKVIRNRPVKMLELISGELINVSRRKHGILKETRLS